MYAPDDPVPGVPDVSGSMPDLKVNIDAAVAGGDTASQDMQSIIAAECAELKPDPAFFHDVTKVLMLLQLVVTVHCEKALLCSIVSLICFRRYIHILKSQCGLRF